MGKNTTGPRWACGLEWPNLSAGTIQHSHIALSWLFVREWKIMPGWIFFLIYQFECKTVFWPCLSVRILQAFACSTWLQYNTSLSLGPRSFIRALLNTLWLLLAFSSWPHKSVCLFPFPMEMAVVLFKYFSFCQYSPPSANFNWSEQREWIQSPARHYLSESLQEEEVELKKAKIEGASEQCGSRAVLQHHAPGGDLCRGLNRSLKGIVKCTILTEMHHF